MNSNDSYAVREVYQSAINNLNEMWSTVGQQAYWRESDLMRPSRVFRPRLFIDGNQWCALYGEDLQEGVAGFGESPELACVDFDREWVTKLQAKGKSEVKL